MNIEKLIEQLKYYGTTYAIGDNLGKEIDGSDELMLDAATALSTLQAENDKLRADLEYEREHANAYHEECGQWEAENEKLRAELEQVKRERDSIEQDFRAFAKQWWEQDSGFPCCWCKFEKSGGCEWKVKHPGEICEGRAFEWRGQRED